MCLCEDAAPDASYDTADLLATSPGLPSGSAALPCDDMLVSLEDKYDKTTTAEAIAIVFIVLIVVGSLIACSVFCCGVPHACRRRQSMLIEENEKKRQAQLANAPPIVHAPPVVQPVVQPGYVQPQVVQGGYGQPQPYPPPTGQVVGAYPPAPPVQGYAPMATGTVVQAGGYQPEGYKPEGY